MLNLIRLILLALLIVANPASGACGISLTIQPDLATLAECLKSQEMEIATLRRGLQIQEQLHEKFWALYKKQMEVDRKNYEELRFQVDMLRVTQKPKSAK